MITIGSGVRKLRNRCSKDSVTPIEDDLEIPEPSVTDKQSDLNPTVHS